MRRGGDRRAVTDGSWEAAARDRVPCDAVRRPEPVAGLALTEYPVLVRSAPASRNAAASRNGRLIQTRPGCRIDTLVRNRRRPAPAPVPARVGHVRAVKVQVEPARSPVRQRSLPAPPANVLSKSGPALPCARFRLRRDRLRRVRRREGRYLLRSNMVAEDPATLWRLYMQLTDVEAVFRSLKSELGLRPIFHRTRKRSDGHLFITVIAYQLVQTVRRRLGEQGQNESWASLRRILEGQQRVTATFRRKDGRTLHVRKPTRAEPRQQAVYRALGADPAPGGVRKMIV